MSEIFEFLFLWPGGFGWIPIGIFGVYLIQRYFNHKDNTIAQKSKGEQT